MDEERTLNPIVGLRWVERPTKVTAPMNSTGGSGVIPYHVEKIKILQYTTDGENWVDVPMVTEN